MRFRITIILMLALGGLTAIATGTILVVSAAANIKNTLELTRQRAELTISLVERSVADHLLPGRNLIAGISKGIADGSLDIGDARRLEDVLTGSLAPAPQLGGIVLWRTDQTGLAVYRQEDGETPPRMTRRGNCRSSVPSCRVLPQKRTWCGPHPTISTTRPSSPSAHA